MLSLTDRDAVTAALTDSELDPELRALIGLRVWLSAVIARGFYQQPARPCG